MAPLHWWACARPLRRTRGRTITYRFPRANALITQAETIVKKVVDPAASRACASMATSL
jgi:hypothetical protein